MQSRFFILILICVLVFSMSSIAQTKQQQLQTIRNTFNNINAEKHYIIKVLENEEFLEHMPDGGGELTGYYKGDTLCKIICRIGLSNGVILDEYYFNDNELVFVYEKGTHFTYIDSLNQMDYGKQKLAYEWRYYFDNGIVLQTIKNGKPFSSALGLPDKDFTTRLLDDSKEYALLLKTKGRRD